MAIEGFTYHPDMISPGEERRLLRAVRAISLETVLRDARETTMQTAHFGWRPGSRARLLRAAPPMPDSLAVPRAVVARAAHVPPWELPQATVLTYRWNDHHRLHRDHGAYGALIACLSLGGAATLAIEEEEGVVRYQIEPRSIYILRGTARWHRHALTAHRQRTSITFRTISGA